MKRNYLSVCKFALVWAVVLIGAAAAFSQDTTVTIFADELRPFDFSNKYYLTNGVEPEKLVNRRNGEDGQSVFDRIDDRRFRAVRILSVYPAYNQDGKTVYFNLYAEFFEDGLVGDLNGKRAAEMAELYPLYIFPNSRKAGFEDGFRQAHLINMRDEGYFEKNPLGLAVQVVVEFTDRIYTDEGQKAMADLAERNGYSGDGTPIIKTVQEIESLTRKRYVTQRIKGLNDPSVPSYAVAKVLQNPQGGAIAPDAFLLNNLGLKAEQHFVEEFECLQTAGKWCSQ